MKEKTEEKVKTEKGRRVCDELERLYPDAVCSLEYSEPHELMIATRLSAQCTDARVNIVTKTLFEKYRTVEDFAAADYEELCEIIRPCGFYRTKARSIIEMCQSLLERFEGRVPDNMEDLLSLSGIGRKTANLLLGDLYGKEGVIIADTHFIRIMKRIGITESTDPKKAEMEARGYIPPERSSDLCHRVVLFGRDICRARKTDCERCPLTDVCRAFVNKKFTIKD